MKKYMLLLILSILTISAIAGSVLPAEQYHRPKIRADTSSSYSLNWAGYALDGTSGSVTDVKGSWIVPSVTCPSKKSQYSSFWVGIDGDNSNTVEQIGTDSDCKNGRPTYYSWYEFYPNPAYYTSITDVKPGDHMSAEVRYDPTSGLFIVSMKNMRNGQTAQYSATVNGAQRSSAEWIAEAPWSGTILPLANFGTSYYGLDYTGISGTEYATINGVTGNINSFVPSGSGVTVDKSTMVNNIGIIKAQPSSVSNDGTSFSVKWYRSN